MRPTWAIGHLRQRFQRIGCRSLTIRRVENQRCRRKAPKALRSRLICRKADQVSQSLRRYRSAGDNLIASNEVQGPVRVWKNGERVILKEVLDDACTARRQSYRVK